MLETLTDDTGKINKILDIDNAFIDIEDVICVYVEQPRKKPNMSVTFSAHLHYLECMVAMCYDEKRHVVTRVLDMCQTRGSGAEPLLLAYRSSVDDRRKEFRSALTEAKCPFMEATDGRMFNMSHLHNFRCIGNRLCAEYPRPGFGKIATVVLKSPVKQHETYSDPEKPQHNMRYTPEDDRVILAQESYDRDIAMALGRDVASIRRRREKLLSNPSLRNRIPMPNNNRPWTEDEKNVLMNSGATEAQAAARLGRSENAIRTMRCKLENGLADHTADNGNELDAFIIDESYSTDEIAHAFGLSRADVITRRRTLRDMQ